MKKAKSTCKKHLSHYDSWEIFQNIELAINNEAGRILYANRDLEKHLKRYAKRLKKALPLLIDSKVEQLVKYESGKDNWKDL